MKNRKRSKKINKKTLVLPTSSLGSRTAYAEGKAFLDSFWILLTETDPFKGKSK